MTTTVEIRRSIDVYIGEDRIVIQPFYTHGETWEGKNGIKCKHSFRGFEVLILRHSTPVSEILDAIDRMSVRCLDDVPDPTEEDRKTGLNLLLKATGEKTWHAITRSYGHISVSEYGQERTFWPSYPEKGGFAGYQEHWKCSFSNREQMEAAFKAAAAMAIEAQNLENPPPLG